jgi:hypothetical protein
MRASPSRRQGFAGVRFQDLERSSRELLEQWLNRLMDALSSVWPGTFNEGYRIYRYFAPTLFPNATGTLPQRVPARAIVPHQAL